MFILYAVPYDALVEIIFLGNVLTAKVYAQARKLTKLQNLRRLYSSNKCTKVTGSVCLILVRLGLWRCKSFSGRGSSPHLPANFMSGTGF